MHSTSHPYTSLPAGRLSSLVLSLCRLVCSDCYYPPVSSSRQKPSRCSRAIRKQMMKAPDGDLPAITHIVLVATACSNENEARHYCTCSCTSLAKPTSRRTAFCLVLISRALALALTELDILQSISGQARPFPTFRTRKPYLRHGPSIIRRLKFLPLRETLYAGAHTPYPGWHGQKAKRPPGLYFAMGSSRSRPGQGPRHPTTITISLGMTVQQWDIVYLVYGLPCGYNKVRSEPSSQGLVDNRNPAAYRADGYFYRYCAWDPGLSCAGATPHQLKKCPKLQDGARPVATQRICAAKGPTKKGKK